MMKPKTTKNILLTESIFEDEKDQVGIIQDQDTSQHFLSLETFTEYERDDDGSFGGYTFSLSKIQKSFSRKAYTFMELVGDVGGFNSAVVILPKIFMSFYSAKVYEKSISSQIPVRDDNRKRRRNQSNLKAKLKRSNQSRTGNEIYMLDKGDINEMCESVKGAQRLKPSYFKVLLSGCL